MAHGSSNFEVLTRAQRILTGLILLLAVDLIWVASSEFTKYIFQDLEYDKPFFSTYFKTSLFMVYLTGFLAYKPWRDQCRRQQRQDHHHQRPHRRYERVNSSDQASDDDPEDEEERAVGAGGSAGIARAEDSDERSTLSRSSSFVGSPTYVPANLPPPDSSGKSSGAESDAGEDSSGNKIRMNGNGIVPAARRVRFKNVAQVVEMHPADALYANLARLSYNASLRAQAALRRAASRLSIKEVVQLALLFCVPWFLGNFCYQEALSETEVAVVNVLSSSSCLFTLILPAIFPSEESDRFTLSKLFAVCFSITGVVLVSYSDLDLEAGSVPAGAIWTLVGAFFYAVYIVLLRRRVNHEDNMDSPMFFGFVGLFNALLLWPGLLVLHFTSKETSEVPTSQQLQFLILNGLLGTVLSEILWLWGCFYTSSLVATLAISLTIPLSILADIIWRGKTYGPIFFVGAVPMFFSFFLVAMLTHYEGWDPLLDLCLAVGKKCRGLVNPAARNNYVFDRQERESLINQQESSHDDSI